MTDKIYVSSLAFNSKLEISKIIDYSINNNIKIEFSSGLNHEKDAKRLILNSGLNCLVHNYFPAPKIPFVLNLASLDYKIREKSIQHCIDGLSFSKAINAPFFSAHFGFCFDFKPSELGGKLEVQGDKINKSKNELVFIESLKIVINYAKKIGIKFLIENNVLSKQNYKGSVNPLLGCSSDEILKFVNYFKSNYFGILLDTAHLKVSSNTLSLNLDDEIHKMKSHIYAIHHSDNDGLMDTNSQIRKDYWFLKYLYYFKNIVHVLEVKNINIDEMNNQIKYLSIGLK